MTTTERRIIFNVAAMILQIRARQIRLTDSRQERIYSAPCYYYTSVMSVKGVVPDT